jgi:hypothetical protein
MVELLMATPFLKKGKEYRRRIPNYVVMSHCQLMEPYEHEQCKKVITRASSWGPAQALLLKLSRVPRSAPFRTTTE